MNHLAVGTVFQRDLDAVALPHAQKRARYGAVEGPIPKRGAVGKPRFRFDGLELDLQVFRAAFANRGRQIDGRLDDAILATQDWAHEASDVGIARRGFEFFDSTVYLLRHGTESIGIKVPEGETPRVAPLRALAFALRGQHDESKEALHQVLEGLETHLVGRDMAIALQTAFLLDEPVIASRLVEELAPQQIADVLGLSSQLVRSNLAVARKQLRRALSDDQHNN